MGLTFLRFKVLQVQQHDFSRVLKESGSVLLFPFLHPVPVDAEGAAVYEFADAAKGVRIPGQHLPSQRPGPAVTAVHPDAGQHTDYQHLRGENGDFFFPPEGLNHISAAKKKKKQSCDSP